MSQAFMLQFVFFCFFQFLIFNMSVFWFFKWSPLSKNGACFPWGKNSSQQLDLHTHFFLTWFTPPPPSSNPQQQNPLHSMELFKDIPLLQTFFQQSDQRGEDNTEELQPARDGLIYSSSSDTERFPFSGVCGKNRFLNSSSDKDIGGGVRLRSLFRWPFLTRRSGESSRMRTWLRFFGVVGGVEVRSIDALPFFSTLSCKQTQSGHAGWDLNVQMYIT